MIDYNKELDKFEERMTRRFNILYAIKEKLITAREGSEMLDEINKEVNSTAAELLKEYIP